MSELDLTKSANNTRPAKLPALSVPRELENQLRTLLEAIKERLEVREGQRGNPFERALTVRDLDQFKSMKAASPTTTAPPVSMAGITESRVRDLVGSALTIEVDTLRSAIANLERSIKLLDGSNSPDSPDYKQVSSGPISKYTKTMLAEDLASGAATILSGALSGTTVMELDPAGNYVLFRHKDANINDLGAGYTGGLVRTAVGITAAGFVAGYNRRSDGVWQNSIIIDSATGNVTILGTLKAGSVIETGATIGIAGTTIGTVATNASAALTLAGDAYNLANSKLSAGSAYVLSGAVTVEDTGGLRAGNVTWNSNTGAVTGGSGVVLTENGLTGAKFGVVTFSIAATGDAAFYGDIDGNGMARFAGNNTAGAVPIQIGGPVYNVQYSSLSTGSSDAIPGNVRAGVIGFATATVSFRNVGVIGKGLGVGKGIGVVGDGEDIGGYFISSGSAALQAISTTGGVAVQCDGKFGFGSYTYDPPDGSTAQYMRRDGTWAVPPNTTLSGPTTGTATANFVSTSKPGVASSSTWLAVVQNGTTYYLPAWT